jgi:hypothetical protein
MVDVRAKLTRSRTVRQVARGGTQFVTIHYNGPSVAAQPNDLKLLQADARFHVNTRGWDGLSYHYGVGRDGETYWCRDYLARLAHSGVTLGNEKSLAVLVITGEGDVPSTEQLQALGALLTSLKISPRYVLGHQEWPRATACPGAQLRRWIAAYRQRKSTQWPVHLHTLYDACNVRDEADVTSHRVRVLGKGAELTGTWTLGKPVKGDCLWLKLTGDEYVHASVLDSASYRETP